jgi:hypothetical protein
MMREGRIGADMGRFTHECINKANRQFTNRLGTNIYGELDTLNTSCKAMFNFVLLFEM